MAGDLAPMCYLTIFRVTDKYEIFYSQSLNIFEWGKCSVHQSLYLIVIQRAEKYNRLEIYLALDNRETPTLEIRQDSLDQCPISINADQNHCIDPKCLSMPIIADQFQSIPLNAD